jgi:mannose-6-phosphate isomerase-like protein (cupin superfamily)
MHITPTNALHSLHQSNKLFISLFEHGSLVVEIYQPQKVDLQQPHDRDEVYVITTGQGKFNHNNTIVSVNSGDFLFVPAGDPHHFFDFSDDFATWVIFYGPKGGELNTFAHENEN